MLLGLPSVAGIMQLCPSYLIPSHSTNALLTQAHAAAIKIRMTPMPLPFVQILNLYILAFCYTLPFTLGDPPPPPPPDDGLRQAE